MKIHHEDSISKEALQKALDSGTRPDLNDLCDVIGIDALKNLLEAYQGITIPVPKCGSLNRWHRDDCIYADFMKGRTFEQLARKYVLSTRRVRTILINKRKDALSASKADCTRKEGR